MPESWCISLYCKMQFYFIGNGYRIVIYCSQTHQLIFSMYVSATKYLLWNKLGYYIFHLFQRRKIYLRRLFFIFFVSFVSVSSLKKKLSGIFLSEAEINWTKASKLLKWKKRLGIFFFWTNKKFDKVVFSENETCCFGSGFILTSCDLKIVPSAVLSLSSVGSILS